MSQLFLCVVQWLPPSENSYGKQPKINPLFCMLFQWNFSLDSIANLFGLYKIYYNHTWFSIPMKKCHFIFFFNTSARCLLKWERLAILWKDGGWLWSKILTTQLCYHSYQLLNVCSECAEFATMLNLLQKSRSFKHDFCESYCVLRAVP